MALTPFAQDVLTRIVKIVRANLYLYVRLNARNQTFGTGLTPVDTMPQPRATVTRPESITLLDQKHTPESRRGAFACMQYQPPQTGVIGWEPAHLEGTIWWSDPIFGPVGQSAQEAYESWVAGDPSGTARVSSPVDGKCSTAVEQWPVASQSSWSATESRSETWYVDLVTVPVNNYSSEVILDEYLYAIGSGDDLISIKVSDLVATAGIVFGRGSIIASVYSTARESITRLDQLIQYGADTSQKLTPDDTRILGLDSDRQVLTFRVGVHSDPDHVQTDNYGDQFNPYKVTFTPSLDSEDRIPPQPPPLLPLPGQPQILVRSDPVPIEDDETLFTDWVVQKVDKTDNTIEQQGSINKTTLLHSISYYKPNTDETRTSLFIPK